MRRRPKPGQLRLHSSEQGPTNSPALLSHSLEDFLSCLPPPIHPLSNRFNNLLFYPHIPYSFFPTIHSDPIQKTILFRILILSLISKLPSWAPFIHPSNRLASQSWHPPWLQLLPWTRIQIHPLPPLLLLLGSTLSSSKLNLPLCWVTMVDGIGPLF